MSAAALVLGDGITPAVRSAVRAARACVGAGGRVDLLLAGQEVASSDSQSRWGRTVNRVVTGKTPTGVSAETMTGLAQHMVGSTDAPKYGYVLAAADTFGKNVMPRLAGTLGVASLTDVTQVVDAPAGVFTRPMYAGNAIATVELKESLKLLTVRPTAFASDIATDSESTDQQQQPSAEELDVAQLQQDSTGIHDRVKWKGMSSSRGESSRPQLDAASVVIAGGRGLKSKEHFAMLEEMADVLDGAVGATRAAVDLGWVPNDMQIGQTGKVVAPDLYFAIGVSGAIQHLAGMKDSKTIVAINKDADAPIFQIADYGLVGDLFEILPELLERLKAIRESHTQVEQ